MLDDNSRPLMDLLDIRPDSRSTLSISAKPTGSPMPVVVVITANNDGADRSYFHATDANSRLALCFDTASDARPRGCF